MSATQWKLVVGVLAGLIVLGSGMVTAVSADPCEVRICRSGYTLTRLRDRPQPVCQSDPAPITGAISFYYAPDPICPPDADLRGQNCVKRICCEKPMCPTDARYENGRCLRGRAPSGIVILRVTCDAGWDLDRPTGMCKKRDCGALLSVPDLPIAVPAPPPVRPGPFVAGFQPQGCVRKNSSVMILGREFGSQTGKGVALGGHGIHVDLVVTTWGETQIKVTLPNDPRIQEGQWYYIGVEKAGHTGWLSNIDKTITVCR